MTDGMPVELSVAFVRATAAAVLVTEDGEREIWLPRSQLHSDSDLDLLRKGEIFEVVLPEWLAYEKGLV